MKKHWTLFLLHVAFWLTIVGMVAADTDWSLTIANKPVPLTGLVIVVMVPVLTVASWHSGRDATSRVLKNYFLAFRAIGPMFLLLVLWLM